MFFAICYKKFNDQVSQNMNLYSFIFNESIILIWYLRKQISSLLIIRVSIYHVVANSNTISNFWICKYLPSLDTDKYNDGALENEKSGAIMIKMCTEENYFQKTISS